MDALLRFCQSTTGMFLLVLLLGALVLLLEGMIITTAIRWFLRFVKDAWYSDTAG